VAQQAKIEIVIDDRQAQRALGNLTNALVSLGAINFVSGLAAQFVQIANSATEMTNKLIFATGSIQNADATLKILAESATRTGSSLAGTVDLFQKLAMSSTFAGSSTESLAYITEQFNKTLQISGTSGAGAASALYQFAQAMQKGSLNGDEFRTIMETNGYLMKILEQQTGKTRTELMAMSSDGRLSAEIIGRALLETTTITDDYGKTVRTLPQAMENFRTSLTLAVKELDKKLGITDALGKALDFMSKNMGVVIGAIGGLAVAVGALLITLIPAATAMAVLTGGLAVAGAVAAGAALGYAAQQAGLFGKESEKAAKSQAEIQKQAKEGLKVSAQRNTQALDLDKTLRQTIDQLKAQNVIEGQMNGQRSLQLEVEKAVAKEREKYKKTGEAIPPQLEKELALETRKSILISESIKSKTKLLELESAIATESIKDAGQRQVASQLESYRLSMTKETYEIYKNQMQAKIQEVIQQRALTEYMNQARQSQIELTNLNIRDLDLREQQVAVDKERLRLGTLFTAEMEAQVRANVKNQQAVKELMATEQQRLLLAGQAQNLSREQQIQTATGAITRLDPRLAAEQQYQTEMQAIRSSEILAEDQKFKYLQQLAREHANKMHEISKQRTEAELRMSGVTNQGIIDSVRKSQDNIRMIQQGGIQAVMGGIDQMAYIFGQLGTYNKRAFEAAKAFNIANAVMNTYLGATKALALYPPPFNFVAAAAVVASGLAQVAAIRSQGFSGRQLGGPVMGGQTYLVGENGPELFTPNTTGSITRNQDIGGNGQVNVNFTIVANDTTGFDQLLNSRRGMIQQIISDAMLEKGRRSMV
jgi:tape measure domain-containing protein